jgi:hypothetical protein
MIVKDRAGAVVEGLCEENLALRVVPPLGPYAHRELLDRPSHLWTCARLRHRHYLELAAIAHLRVVII